MTVKNSMKGFTLIELLIVVAILGILGAILFVTIGGSPQVKARDARRIADINQMQLALELCKNDDTCNSGNYPNSLATQLVPKYIGGIPTDPKTGTAYLYSWNPAAPTAYHLGAILEDPTNKALCTDADATSVGWAGGSKFNGKNATATNTNCGTTTPTSTNDDDSATAAGPIYDVQS